MVIFNNMAAMSALNETNRNTSKLGKTIKQATSGMRLNSAGDDASGYSISERMRVKIRALGQCKENSAKGQDLIDTASAAVDQQVNIMKQVKTIALRARIHSLMVSPCLIRRWFLKLLSGLMQMPLIRPIGIIYLC